MKYVIFPILFVLGLAPFILARVIIAVGSSIFIILNDYVETMASLWLYWIWRKRA